MPRASWAINRFLIFFSLPSRWCLSLIDDVTKEESSINSKFWILNQWARANMWDAIPAHSGFTAVIPQCYCPVGLGWRCSWTEGGASNPSIRTWWFYPTYTQPKSITQVWLRLFPLYPGWSLQGEILFIDFKARRGYFALLWPPL